MLNELTLAENLEVLENNSVGRVGCTDGTNVYIIPMNYKYENNAIICCSLEGLKIQTMKNHPDVCFEVDEIEDRNHWKCVVTNGLFEEITDKEELADLIPHYEKSFSHKRVSLSILSPFDESDTMLKNHNVSAQVYYKIKSSKISGRYQNGY